MLKEELLTASEQLQHAEAAAADVAQRAEHALEQAQHMERALSQAQAAQHDAKAAQAALQQALQRARDLMEPAQERAEQAEEDLEAAQAALHEALATQGHLQVLSTCKKTFPRNHMYTPSWGSTECAGHVSDNPL